VGNTISVTDPRSITTTFEFDNERRLIQRTEAAPFGYVTAWQYNSNGWLTTLNRETADLEILQTWSWTYLENGLLQIATDPAGNPLSFAYDTLARMTTRTDAESRTYQFSYDALSRISTVTDPMLNVADTRTYTENGMLASRQDAAANVTLYVYDGFDRLSEQKYPDSTNEQFTYDANDSTLTIITRNVDTITNTYDVLTRLTSCTPGSLPEQTFSYDLAGRSLSVSTSGSDPGSGTYGYSYDTAGRLLVQTMPNSNTVTYQLDQNGNRTRLIWPDAYYADYVFDELNRLTDIKLNGATTSSLSFGYDDLSRRTQVAYANGCVSTFEYGLSNNLTSLDQTFVGSSVSFDFNYNAVHQVTNFSIDDTSYLWMPTTTATVTYGTANDLNQYPSVGGTSYSYDNNGCLTAGPLSATFDTLNRVTQVVSGSITNDYWIDPLNRQTPLCQSNVRHIQRGD